MLHLLQQNGITAGFSRFLEQLHTSLRGSATSFFRIASTAGADNIFPAHASAVRTGNNMIQAKLLHPELLSAVLAAIAVPDEDIAAIEFDSIVGDTIIVQQAYNAGNLNFEVD